VALVVVVGLLVLLLMAQSIKVGVEDLAQALRLDSTVLVVVVEQAPLEEAQLLLLEQMEVMEYLHQSQALLLLGLAVVVVLELVLPVLAVLAVVVMVVELMLEQQEL
jgi:hypothetical protein